MKNRISALLLLILIFTLIFLSCSKDNEILATSRIKDIAREDFYTWLESKKIKKETILGSKKKQIRLLEMMAMEFFIMDKAKSEGFDKNRNVIIEKEKIRKSLLDYYLNKTLTDTATYTKPAIRVSYILLNISLFKPDPEKNNKRVRLEPEEVSKNYDELLLKAKDIIKRLDEGDSFEKLAAEFSSDSTKTKGGDLGYILKDMMPDYFSEPAFRLKKSEYTKTPVMTPRGVYIIKVTDKVDLTEKNIDKVIKDKKQHGRMVSYILTQYKKDYIAALKKAKDVEFLYKKGESYSNTDTLFRIGTKEYTLSDIGKNIENRLSQDELLKRYKDGVLPDNVKLGYVEQYFKELLVTREAERVGIDKKPEYLKELREREINLIMTGYLNYNLSEVFYISDQEIIEEYERERVYKYTQTVMENGVKIKKSVPLDAVKEDIIEGLKKKASNPETTAKMQARRQQIFDEYSLKINESKLNGV